MRVAGLHVDGYGALADLDLGPLGEGLSVIIGPNEAGKSTLLDFVRGVLFGFPDRRHRSPFHEPLRGGRHGGSLRLQDNDGSPWMLERHLDRRAPLLTGPDGQLGDEATLHDLLGGADDTLFRSVFAFGLGELANFETLDKDEVRELVFSAGVLGAGRSATKAIRALDQQRLALIRPRQQQALANQLRLRLEELDQQLRSARAATSSYATAKAECERLAMNAKAARQETEALHLRARELERLESCWAPWRRREEAAAALEELGALPSDSRALAAATLEIRGVTEELSGHEERGRLAQKLESQMAGIERELELRLGEIGFDPTTRVLPPLDLGLEEHVGEVARRHRETDTARRTLEEELRRADAELAQAREELHLEQAKGPAREAEALAALVRSTQQLRGLLITLDRLEAEEAGKRHEAALAAMALPRREAPQGALIGAIVLLAACAVLCVIATLGHRADPLPAGLAGAALLGGLVLVVRARRAGNVATVAPEEAAPEERSARVAASIEELAAGLGLPGRPEDAELEAFGLGLDAERERRQRVDELARGFARSRRRSSEVRERLDGLERHAAELEEELRGIAEKLDLPAGLGPEALCRAIDAMREAYGLVAASARVAPELAALRDAAASYESRVASLLERLGMEPLGPGTLGERLGELARRHEAALAGEDHRGQLAREVATAEAVLDEALGSGPDATRLRGELASGAVMGWAEERRGLEQRFAEADARYDAELEAQHDAERALRELLSSETIASLELEREAAATELDRVLERWLVLGLSGRLLQATLARYESERQPLVISRAAELFSGVTEGRYVKLVAREDTDQHRHGIEAITPSGARVDAADLSRGTAEQLYLCLRLAFATTFAARAAALPLVLDDVLVNFDPERSAAMARAIGQVAREHQVIVFTCHPHVVSTFAASSPELKVLELERH